MAILLFCVNAEHLAKSPQNTNCPYLQYMKSDQKNKGTLFSSTFKVEDKKVHLFFQLGVNPLRYRDFVIFPILPFLGPFLNIQTKFGGSKTHQNDLKFHILTNYM